MAQIYSTLFYSSSLSSTQTDQNRQLAKLKWCYKLKCRLYSCLIFLVFDNKIVGLFSPKKKKNVDCIVCLATQSEPEEEANRRRCLIIRWGRPIFSNYRALSSRPMKAQSSKDNAHRKDHWQIPALRFHKVSRVKTLPS